jgi:hypothetical protein
MLDFSHQVVDVIDSRGAARMARENWAAASCAAARESILPPGPQTRSLIPSEEESK